MIRNISICLLFIIIINYSFAQSILKSITHPYSLQYGYSVKATLEFPLTFTSRPFPTWRISGDVGIGSNFIDTWLYPSFNLEIDLYNGGYGSRNVRGFFPRQMDLDIITAFTLTGGVKNHLLSKRSASLVNRNIPLYYFSNFVYPALQNPFDYSFSFGTNIIFTPLNKEKQNQRTGFINGHFDRIQITYGNDGGPIISGTSLGDRKDRYYTGIGIVSYHGKSNSPISLVELSYKKFTGYTKNAFEVSNELYFNYMDYSSNQRNYNKSLWSLNIGNPSKGWGLNYNLYNSVFWDVQHLIHWSIANTYHMVPYNKLATLSGSYFNSTSKIGMQ